MKLLVSFNLLDLETALTIARSIEQQVDLFTVGPLLLHKYGVDAVKRFKEALPKVPLIAEAQVLEYPQEAISLFSDAGADWISVMAGAGPKVITTACSTARNKGTKIMVDLADASSAGQSALDAKRFGADALTFHRPSVDDDRVSFIDQWHMVKGNTELPIFVSAHVSRQNVGEILGLEPAGIIIGSSIVDKDNPLEEALYFSELIKNN